MPSGASERLVWAVETLDITGTEQLLEIGCGHGVTVSLICERLTSGHITALDRSAKMIAEATKRNTDCMAAGKASLLTASLTAAEFGSKRFDKIFALRVGAFVQGGAEDQLNSVRNHLAASGRFYLIYDPPRATQLEGVVMKATAALKGSGMRVLEVQRKRLANTEVVCIVATAS